jgi:hypothetical protein
MAKHVNSVLLSLLAGAMVGCGQSGRLADCDGHGRVTGVELVLVRAAITDEALDLRYQIRNNSSHDVWVCDDINVTGQWHIETYLLPEERTLLIRRRVGTLANIIWSGGTPDGRYVRLPHGQVREEGLRFTLPVRPRTVYAHTQEATGALAYADRVLVDIGYYDEDLPRLIRTILAEAECSTSSFAFIPTLGGELDVETLYRLNRYNKDLNDPDEPVTIPHIPYRAPNRELSIQLAAEDLRIPFEETAPTARAGTERTCLQSLVYLAMDRVPSTCARKPR